MEEKEGKKNKKKEVGKRNFKRETSGGQEGGKKWS